MFLVCFRLSTILLEQVGGTEDTLYCLEQSSSNFVMLCEDATLVLEKVDGTNVAKLWDGEREDLRESQVDFEMVEWVNCDAHGREVYHSLVVEGNEIGYDW